MAIVFRRLARRLRPRRSEAKRTPHRQRPRQPTDLPRDTTPAGVGARSPPAGGMPLSPNRIAERHGVAAITAEAILRRRCSHAATRSNPQPRAGRGHQAGRAGTASRSRACGNRNASLQSANRARVHRVDSAVHRRERQATSCRNGCEGSRKVPLDPRDRSEGECVDADKHSPPSCSCTAKSWGWISPGWMGWCARSVPRTCRSFSRARRSRTC